MFSAAYHTFLYNPLLNALLALYNTVAFHDLGIAIILLTIIVRTILFPVFQKSVRYQAAMQAIQPKITKLKEVHKNNLEEQSRAMMALYKEHNVNPFSGIFFLFIQLPILIALYQIFFQSLTPGHLTGIYSFIHIPQEINTTLFHLINLKNSSMVIVVIAAVAQYLQGRMGLSKTQQGQAPLQSERMARQMVFIGPLITILILWRMPAAVGLYWLTTSLFSLFQQYLVNKESINQQPIHHGTLESLRS